MNSNHYRIMAATFHRIAKRNTGKPALVAKTKALIYTDRSLDLLAGEVRPL
jgi:hypothetical protein